jgi:hypothetical protein
MFYILLLFNILVDHYPFHQKTSQDDIYEASTLQGLLQRRFKVECSLKMFQRLKLQVSKTTKILKDNEEY